MKKLIYSFFIAGLIMLASCQKEPNASFSASKTSAEIGEPITFTNTSGDGKSYKWEFGDGQTSTEKSPSHSYIASGNYTVKMTAYSKNSKKSDEATAAIFIKEQPTKCWITGVTFTMYPTDDNGYYWDNSTAGLYPDIYFVISSDNAANNILYNPGVASRKENVTSAPFGWTWTGSGLEMNIFQTMYFHLYDYESVGSDTWMGGCGGFSLSEYRHYPYPSTITLTCGSVGYNLSVTWGN